MKRYLHLFLNTFSVSANVMMMYRSNIVFFLFFETVFLMAQFMIVSVGFDLAGSSVAGWTKDQAYLLTAVNGLSHQVFICFFINPIFSLSTQVWNGQYDYILLKPLHPLAGMFFVGQFVISNLPNLATNLCVVIYFLFVNSTNISAGTVAVFALLVVLGILVRVAVGLICISPVFFSERLADVEDSFWSLTSLGRFPMSVYPRLMERVLTLVVPIAMLASLPASFFFGRESMLSVGSSLLTSLLFCFFAFRVFMLSLRRYQSVNSGL